MGHLRIPCLQWRGWGTATETTAIQKPQWGGWGTATGTTKFRNRNGTGRAQPPTPLRSVTAKERLGHSYQHKQHIYQSSFQQRAIEMSCIIEQATAVLAAEQQGAGAEVTLILMVLVRCNR